MSSSLSSGTAAAAAALSRDDESKSLLMMVETSSSEAAVEKSEQELTLSDPDLNIPESILGPILDPRAAAAVDLPASTTAQTTTSSREEAIRQLLMLCEDKQIEVPNNLRQRLMDDTNTQDAAEKPQPPSPVDVPATATTVPPPTYSDSMSIVSSATSPSNAAPFFDAQEGFLEDFREEEEEDNEETTGHLILSETEEEGDTTDQQIHVTEEVEDEEEEAKSLFRVLLRQKADRLAQLEDDKLMKDTRKVWETLHGAPNHECRIQNGSYIVTTYQEAEDDEEEEGNKEETKQQEEEEKKEDADEEMGEPRHQEFVRATQEKLKTILQSSSAVDVLQTWYMDWKKTITTFVGPEPLPANVEITEHTFLEGVQLHLQSGRMYLIVGGPGRTALLHMISNTLQQDYDHVVRGSLRVNGLSPKDEGVVWTNLVATTTLAAVHDQYHHHPGLTVEETLKFAWECRTGGTHAAAKHDVEDNAVKSQIETMDKDHWLLQNIVEGTGLKNVKDTVVGRNQNSTTGPRGGHNRRLTVAETAAFAAPVVCCDEFNAGMDAATTFETIKFMGDTTRLTQNITVVSLSQPTLETIALFDEIILVDKERIIYCGPVDNVVDHFDGLGYFMPERMDLVTWLQQLPTEGGRKFLKNVHWPPHLTSEAFQEYYDCSAYAQAVQEHNESPISEEYTDPKALDWAKTRYRNIWYSSLGLLIGRELLLWWRNKYRLKARFIQTIVTGITVGTVFWQEGDDPQSVMGVLFLSMFFAIVAALLEVPGQFDTRAIFYKHQDANLFPTWCYIVARSICGFPSALIDTVIYTIIVYWFVDLSNAAGNFLMFISLLVTTSMTTGLVFSVFSATIKEKSTGQACMSVCLLILMLFSGFPVQPDVLPNGWVWVYWLNIFGWILRGLVVNEFQSAKFSDIESNELTVGENALIRFGFEQDGEAYEYGWAWYAMLFAVLVGIATVSTTTYFLSYWRFGARKILGNLNDDDDEVGDGDELKVEEPTIPFQQANLTFKGVWYAVKALPDNVHLDLLKGVDGYIEAGKLTALMSDSGAGKSKLMECLALRKTGGKFRGDVRLNGHEREEVAFHRSVGYVEQSDLQSPTLTIRETIEFSAKLRLDESDDAVNEESIKKFIDQTVDMLELTLLQHLQVGGGLSRSLSLEQRRRLSIAVELVANPSIIFLDEPMSGLDTRAVDIMMRCLKRIAVTGRGVCATIHQPSIAILNSFDSLLLLNRGGEVVFCGELGDESAKLIKCLEDYEGTTKIKKGENPAAWMITQVGAGLTSSRDYATAYHRSELRAACLSKIDEICSKATEANKITFKSKYATSQETQKRLVELRMAKIYWRSPTYSLARLLLLALVAVLFGSTFTRHRTPEIESDMNSRATCMFVAYMFFAIDMYFTVLSVYDTERSMFHRHTSALLYDERVAIRAFTVVELPFIALASLVFCVIFYFLVGLSSKLWKFLLYYLFFTLNLVTFSVLGQMVMSLVREIRKAQIAGGLLITLTAVFSGLLIRPQNIKDFWFFAYWLLPGHYVLEGLIASQFYQDETPVLASPGTPFFETIGCIDLTVSCLGDAEIWVSGSFGGEFDLANLGYGFLYLFALIVSARIITWTALVRLDHLAK